MATTFPVPPLPARSSPRRVGWPVQRVLAWAAVLTQAGIAVTGSVVRVTSSGLGCPTWPQCFPGSLVPVASPTVTALRSWIEFSNRLVIVLVGGVAVLCVAAALLAPQVRRRHLLLALVMPLGVLAQAVMGGVTVLVHLAWPAVAAHFLVSPLLVWVAVLLVAATREGDQPPDVARPVRALVGVLGGALVVLLAAGTLVTAAGPHAGDAATPRLDTGVEPVLTAHTNIVALFAGVLVAVGFALRATRAPAALWRAYLLVVAAFAVQAVIGIVQTLLGVPEVLVSLHVAGAVVLTAAVAHLWTTTRSRGPLPGPAGSVGPSGWAQVRWQPRVLADRRHRHPI